MEPEKLLDLEHPNEVFFKNKTLLTVEIHAWIRPLKYHRK